MGEKTKLGGHYLLALNRPFSQPDFSKRWHTLGVTFDQEESLWGLDAYVETNLLLTEVLNISGVAIPNGWGSYAAFTSSPLPWKIKLEAKDYRDYKFDFRRPPTLEEDVVVSLNTENSSAVKLGLEHRNSPTSFGMFGSYLVGDERITAIHHAVAGVRFRGFGESDWESKLGYRLLPGHGDLAHAAVKAKFPFSKGRSAELGFRKQYSRDGLDSVVSTEDRNIVDLGYSFSDQLSIALGYEFLPENDLDRGQHFANAALTFKRGEFSARSMVGTTSGGTLCSGGVCRRVPPFSGAMVETTYQF